MAPFCRFYERYYGKRCVVDLEAKNEFLSPLINYINKTYGRDEDLKNIYQGIAQQAALLHQITQRKIRYLNVKGVTQVERKIDPSTGRLVENEVPNPLSASIVSDTKQIIAMLKEMGLTPKSTKEQDTGESDPASLARAMHREQMKKQEDKMLTEAKQKRYKMRGQITSAEQLLALIEEKKQFAKISDEILSGEEQNEDETHSPQNGTLPDVDKEQKDEQSNPAQEENINNEQQIKEALASKILNNAPSRREGAAVEVPEEIQKVLDRLNKNGGK